MNEGIILGDSVAAQTAEYVPQLTGVGEEKVVAVLNPLPHDFRVAFARQQAYRPTPDPNRQFAREKGLPLDRSDAKSYVSQDVVLQAGKIKNLPGDIAQIAVRKLVNTIIQTRNNDGSYDFEKGGENKRLVSDPSLRKDIESEIVKGVYDATSFFNQETPKTTPQEIEALNEPVKEATNERPAPGTGSNYTPAPTVPAGAGQPSTAQPQPAKAAASPAKAK